MSSAKTTGANASNNSSSGARSRDHNQGNQGRTFTQEQKEAVLRIRRCKPTAFYDILALTSKTCTDAEIKRAYRKQSLLTHPDKNGYEHADEAFKMVSRAFSVLGDKEKREKFDRFGTDPDSRFESARAQNPFSGFAQRNAGGGGGGGGGGFPGFAGGFEEEISPEEMFRRFFGGGGFGQFGGFDTGPQFVFNMGGGPGIRVHQFGGNRPRRRPRAEGEPDPDAGLLSTLLGLLPILFLFIIPLISSIMSGGSNSMPDVVFDEPQAPFTHKVKIPEHNVHYYVRPTDWQQFKGNNHKIAQLNKHAHVTLVNTLTHRCNVERHREQQLREQAQGWFFQDPEKMKLADQFKKPACERLSKMSTRF
ncbi:hypothetical protein PpBr36_04376 [Pyricularia pennisetigena]|uniref:hypothetical protein n=1 Tax=Pyricularia pennisetigena TaxID=1578925 RepID=UPI00115480B0|nr:hypothetical protein PpBr36_04376 [Pyricularia pennisetigena]TLS27497.1 hypothetical protein PpBr36_04376 [Pyricularia pennisetigena]